jgi:putative ATPase
MNLFESGLDPHLKPLAERLRPRFVKEVVGQDHVLSEKQPLGRLLKNGRLVNLIITGPPGTGKTSCAKAWAQTAKATFMALNAVDAGVKDLKQAGETGHQRLVERGEKTLLFVDEIHRFNKSQQDVLLPFIERGDLYLVGATTEHPSYELNRALLSRCQVIEFKRLEPESFKLLAKRFEEFEKIEIGKIVSDAAFENLVNSSDGDGRRFLNYLESAYELYKISDENFPLTPEILQQLVGSKVLGYDKKSDQHYDCISAFIKSVRGSDADAALYYMARMLEGGEDPVFIARRMIILASEDIGNAEPRALPLAMAGLQAVEAIGMPEAGINLAHVVTFLASCPKSNRAYNAYNKARSFVKETGSVDLPPALKSSSKGSGEYIYPHDQEKAYVEQNYWPPALEPQHFYEPSTRGHEKIIIEYQKWIKNKV